MKQIILLIVITVAAMLAMSQICPAQTANYEAANRKLKLVDNPQQILIAAPPTAAQSKAELQTLKAGMAKVDEKKSASSARGEGSLQVLPHHGLRAGRGLHGRERHGAPSHRSGEGPRNRHGAVSRQEDLPSRSRRVQSEREVARNG